VKSQERLASKESWEKRWQQQDLRIEFDPKIAMFVDLHRIFNTYIPKGRNLRFIEIGAYPGQYLWYFHRFFSHQVYGLEYTNDAFLRMQKHPSLREINAKFINADFFEYQPNPAELWDVVASFGFVEHFTDTREVVARHFEFVKPNGLVIIVIPNHAGLCGTIMKYVDIKKHKTHNLMSYDDLENSFNHCSPSEILFGGYLGHIGFWNTCLYETIKPKGKLIYFIVRAPLWLVEKAGKVLKESRLFSPYSVIIARKTLKKGP